jgi:hypothetical protein
MAVLLPFFGVVGAKACRKGGDATLSPGDQPKCQHPGSDCASLIRAVNKKVLDGFNLDFMRPSVIVQMYG